MANKKTSKDRKPRRPSRKQAEDAVRTRAPAEPPEPDRVLIFLQGHKPAGKPFSLQNASVLRLRGEDVVGACGGDASAGPSGDPLRTAVLEILTDEPVGESEALA